jgi:tRNA-modifying protein YgfZ
LFLGGLAPLPCEAILAGDKSLGTMGSSADGAGLALIRIDRASDALDTGTPLTSGGLGIRLAEPAEVRPAPKQTVA